MLKVFPIYYFPPIHWYAAAYLESSICLEVWQSYRKQQFTSRTHIRTSNRVLALTIPIERRSARAPIKEKRISYAESWQRQHWRSLAAAYRNSPYYEYYEDKLRPLYTQSYDWLVDFLWESTETTNRLLGWEVDMQYTTAYRVAEKYEADYRPSFDASRRSWPSWFIPQSYPQVFEGFEPGLSILDLLFNEGPEAASILKASYQNEG